MRHAAGTLRCHGHRAWPAQLFFAKLRLALRAAGHTPRPGPVWVPRDHPGSWPCGAGAPEPAPGCLGLFGTNLRLIPEKANPLCEMKVGTQRDSCHLTRAPCKPGAGCCPRCDRQGLGPPAR